MKARIIVHRERFATIVKISRKSIDSILNRAWMESRKGIYCVSVFLENGQVIRLIKS